MLCICQKSHKALTLTSCKPWWWTDHIATLWVKNVMFYNCMNKNVLSWNKEVIISVQWIPVLGTALKIMCLILVITRLVKTQINMSCSWNLNIYFYKNIAKKSLDWSKMLKKVLICIQYFKALDSFVIFQWLKIA